MPGQRPFGLLFFDFQLPWVLILNVFRERKKGRERERGERERKREREKFPNRVKHEFRL